MIVTGSRLPRFQGPFQSFKVKTNTNREKGTESGLLVYSQGSRAVVSKFLWLKWLWDELSRREMELFLALPETLNSEMKFGALRASLLKGKKVTRERLNQYPFKTKKEQPNRQRYQGIKNLDVEILDFTRSLPKVPKFSGWVKSSSQVGSKRKPGGPSFLEPLAIIENDYADNNFDWFSYLTVGEQYILPSEYNNHPDET